MSQIVALEKFIYKIEQNLNKRNSKYFAVCIRCQHERSISYCQVFNIQKGKCKNVCRKCIASENSNSGRFTKGQRPWNAGKKYKPQRSYEKNKNHMEIINTLGGIIFSEEILQSMRKPRPNLRGKNHHAWKGDDFNRSARQHAMGTFEYKELRRLVFKRDDYSCQLCKQHGGKLEMDHIKEWSNYPELRYDSSNCRTLCKSCHKKTDNYAGKALRKTTCQ